MSLKHGNVQETKSQEQQSGEANQTGQAGFTVTKRRNDENEGDSHISVPIAPRNPARNTGNFQTVANSQDDQEPYAGTTPALP